MYSMIGCIKLGMCMGILGKESIMRLCYCVGKYVAVIIGSRGVVGKQRRLGSMWRRLIGYRILILLPIIMLRPC